MLHFNENLNLIKCKPLIMKVICFAFFSVLLACTSSKSGKPAQDVLRFGHGGGVVGKEHSYFLKNNRELSGADCQTVRLSSNQYNQLLKNIEVLGIRKIHYRQPGNLYKFIEIEIPEIGWQRIVWDPSDSQVPSELTLFYEFASHFLKFNQ